MFAQERWSCVQVGSLGTHGRPVGGSPGAWVEGGARADGAPRGPSRLMEFTSQRRCPHFADPEKGVTAVRLTRRVLGPSLGQAAAGASRARCAYWRREGRARPGWQLPALSGVRPLPALPWTLTSPAVGPFLLLKLPCPQGSTCAPWGVSAALRGAGCGPWPRRECV